MKAARIPPRYAHCTLDSFNLPIEHGSLSWAHQTAKGFVRDFPAVKGGLLFVGNAGVGKTHLAVGILKEIINKLRAPCLFYECGALFKEIQDSYSDVSKTSELRLLAPVYEAELLVLDELGTVMPTGWVFDTLYQLINTRYNNQKVTIFTTNYPDMPRLQKIEDETTPTRSFAVPRSVSIIENLTTLEERISTRVRSRLYEMCTKVVMDGGDYRRLAQSL
jgi:DNA replication protein DnaC